MSDIDKMATYGKMIASCDLRRFIKSVVLLYKNNTLLFLPEASGNLLNCLLKLQTEN